MRYPHITLLALTFSVAACDTSVDPADTPDASVASPDAPLPADCAEATEHSDLAWIQDNVFSRNCAALGSCHRGAALTAAGLNLEAGNTEANVVDVPSREVQGATLVVPGDPAGSLLMVIMDHESKGGRFSGALPSGGTMPLNLPLLCLEKREAVERWILSLAAE